MMENGISRRKVLRLTLAAVSLGLLGGRAPAAKEPKTDSSLPVIVVGSDNYPPFNYAGSDGRPMGVDVELATEAFRQRHLHPARSGGQNAGRAVHDQAAGPRQRLPDVGEVLPESGMNLPPDFTTLPKHDKVKILCPSSKKDTSGGGESCRKPTQHDTASQPRTERMLLQWNRAKRPLI